MLKVQELIKNNKDWRDILSNAPYHLVISEKEMYGRNLVCLKYNQIESDFSNEIVRECRGLILDSDTTDIVCYPFYKFFNYGEANQAEIDWNTAFVSSKIDGSIIKVVRIGDDFLISTNGMIDAFECSLGGGVGCPFDNFGDLFMEGMRHYGLTKDDFPRLFKEGYTYMFELTSPYNQVVVQWNETKVWLIGIRDNRTLKEIKFTEHELSKVFDTPEIYQLKSVEDCIAAAKVLPDDEEGYVVCDANFNRIKIKSPRYVQLHYMAGNQIWSASRVIDIIRDNEVSEYVAYFPRFKVAFDEIKDKYDAYVRELREVKNAIDQLLEVYNGSMQKKDFAKWVFANNGIRPHSGFAFSYFDSVYAKSKKDDAIVSSIEKYISKIPTSKLVDVLGV